MSKEDQEVKEAILRQGKIFLLENEIVTSEAIINDLIMFGFVSNKHVQDVAISIDEEKRIISYVLYFGWFWYRYADVEKIQKNLETIITDGLKEYKVIVAKQLLSKKEGSSYE